MGFYKKAASIADRVLKKSTSVTRKVTTKVKNWGKRTAASIKSKLSYAKQSTKVQARKAAHDSWRQTKQVGWRCRDVGHTLFVVLPAMLVMGAVYTVAWVYDLLSTVIALLAELWVSMFDILAHLVGLLDLPISGLFYMFIIAPVAFLIAKFSGEKYHPVQAWKPDYAREVNSVRWLLTPVVILPIVLLTPFLGVAEVKAYAADWTEKGNWWGSSLVDESFDTALDLSEVEKEHTIQSPVRDEKIYTQSDIVQFLKPGSDLPDHDEVHVFNNTDGSVHVLVIGLDTDFNFDMSPEDAANLDHIKARVESLRNVVNEVVPPQNHGYTAKPSDYDYEHARNRHDRSYLVGRAYVSELYHASGYEVLKPTRANRVWGILLKKATEEGNHDIAQLRRGFEEELKLIQDSVTPEPTA